jgi:hypothetical protein
MDNREKLPKIENKISKPLQNGSSTTIPTTCACGHLDEKEEMKNIK